MKHVEIWYCDSLIEAQTWEKVLEFEHPDPQLEDIFRHMNLLDGSEAPALIARRSMSVGDIVVIDRRVYRCAMTGWWEFPNVLAYLILRRASSHRRLVEMFNEPAPHLLT